MNPLPQGGLLTGLLQVLIFNITGASGRLVPDAQWLLVTFFGIELILTGIWFMFRHDLDLWQLYTRTITAAIFGWLIVHWVPVTKALMTGFLGAGLKAGGDVLTELDFTNPDRILAHGFGVTAVIFNMIADTSSWSLKTQVLNLLAGIVTIFTMLIYISLALVVFLSLIEFYGSLPVTLLLLPFGMLSFTRWLSEKAIAHTFAGAIRIGAIAFVLASALPLMVSASWSSANSLAVAFYSLIIAAGLAGAAWRINKWVSSILHGNVAVGPQDVAQQLHTLTRQITQLGAVMQTMADLAARTDPAHPTRQPSLTRRRP